MQTSMRVATENRDALADVAREYGVTLDEALGRVLWEHRARRDIARLQADPDDLAAMQATAADLAEVDVAVAAGG